MKKIMSFFIAMTLLMSTSLNVLALESDDEIIGTTKFVDENGNINEITVHDGSTDYTINSKSRLVETANMVNFNCSKAGTTTNYTDYFTGQDGYLSKANGADAAYLGTENGKVKFMMSGVVGLVDPDLVEVVPQGTYYASNYEVNSKGLLYHYISTNVNATGNSSGQNANYNYVGEAPSYLKTGAEYYSYDGHYFYTNYNTMINDYKNNVRTNAVNCDNPYYFYYQYLPLRSQTNYTGEQLTTYLNSKANSSTSKLNNTGEIFVKYQNQYGVNALLAASFAALESGWGKSSIAINKNNLFGLNAVDSNPGNADTFDSVEDSIYNFTSSWMSKRYLNAKYTNLFRGGFYGDKGSGIFGKYSSDPYEGEKCASIAANMDAGISSLDKNYYTIGIKDVLLTTHTTVNVRKESNTNSTVFYTTLLNAPIAFIVRNKTEENGFYKIQSDSALLNDRSGVSDNANYNYNTSYAYISNKYVSIVNNGNDVNYSGNNTQNTEGEPTGKDTTEPTLYYQANCQNTGWLEQVNEPNTAGTTGQSLDLYQLRIKLENTNSQAILSGKVYTNGEWIEYSNISSNTVIGNENHAMQFVNFTLNNLSGYQLQYRVHSADVGWQNWVDAGTQAGTSNKNIQAIEFRLIKIAIPISSVTLNKVSLNLVQGSTSILSAKIIPSDTTDSKMLTWKSSDIAVATVDSNGKVTAINVGTATITVTTSNNKTATCQVTVTKARPTLEYQTHVQDIGWQSVVTEGNISGTTGKSKRLEGIKISLKNNESYTGDIEYRTHVQDYGWQNWVSDGETSGTSGQSKRLEAIQIRLTGEMADNYDIYYRVHAQEFGWLDWAKNGEMAGTAGYSYRLEAIEIKLVEKEGSAPGSTSTPFHQKCYVGYKTHVQDYGWQGIVYDGSTSGTTGRLKRLEGIQIKLENPLYEGNIEYKAHIQDIGWETSWKSNGSTSGTTGKAKRLEAIKIKLTGEMAERYDIYYRVHAQDYGWLGWTSNGASAGTEGLAKRLEAIQIKLVKKGGVAPGSIDKAFIKK